MENTQNLNKQVPVQVNTNQFKFPDKIPITYLWFGKNVPQDYLISLAQVDYPVIFLKNPDLERQFKRQILDIQKSDYYRLYYLYQHGGIYSDFDNTIDYPCLMKILEPYRNQKKLVFMTDQKHTRQKMKEMTTNLIFAPYPKMPQLKKMLDAVDQTKRKVWNFAGMKFVARFSQPLEVPMGKCVKHSYDWSWFQASNEVLGKKNQAHPEFQKKRKKKTQIIKQKQLLSKSLYSTKKKVAKLQKQIRDKNKEKQNIKQKIQSSLNQAVDLCPLVTKIFQQKLSQFKMNLSVKNKINDQKNIQNNDIVKKAKAQNNAGLQPNIQINKPKQIKEKDGTITNPTVEPKNIEETVSQNNKETVSNTISTGSIISQNKQTNQNKINQVNHQLEQINEGKLQQIEQEQTKQQQQNLQLLLPGQKFILQSRIRQLQALNRNLVFERDMYDLQVKIGILIIFFMMIVGFFLMKYKNQKSFKKIRNLQNTQFQEK